MSDRLLYTLSTRGAVRLEQFHELLEDASVSVASETDTFSNIDPRIEVARLLGALGHCEFDYEKRQVWACPPSLILLPAAGLPQAVLTGARTPALLQNLKKAVQLKKQDAVLNTAKLTYEGVILPAVVTVLATSLESLRAIAKTAGIRWASDQAGALRLAAFSSDKDAILAKLFFSEKADIDWPSSTFSVPQLSFVRNVKESGYRLVCYKSPIDQQLQHWLWDGSRSAIVERDWGRFLALGHSDKQVIFYDTRKQRVCVPTSTWLPAILARALTLCSGQPPTRYRLAADHLGISADQPFHVYAGVPMHIAELVGGKLGQRLINARCDENEAHITPC